MKSYFRTQPNLVTTKFQETPRLPTYAVAFLLAKGYKEYEIEDTGSSLRQRIIAEDVKNPKNLALYSEFVKKAFTNLESYFGPLDYLPKLDHVCIPNTESGGMENWGLIVYNAMYINLDAETQPSMRLNINSIVAHEIAHMWFGNTITSKYWRNIWMTESLATFYGWKIYESVSLQFYEICMKCHLT